MITIITRKLLTLYYQWKFRKHDPAVCCCGSYEKDHGYTENHGFVSMVDYTVSKAVEAHRIVRGARK